MPASLHLFHPYPPFPSQSLLPSLLQMHLYFFFLNWRNLSWCLKFIATFPQFRSIVNMQAPILRCRATSWGWGSARTHSFPAGKTTEELSRELKTFKGFQLLNFFLCKRSLFTSASSFCHNLHWLILLRQPVYLLALHTFTLLYKCIHRGTDARRHWRWCRKFCLLS